jgi:2'-5' RNA ligase
MGLLQSIWLLPAEPVRSALRTTVRNLASKYESADFEPHVTLYSGETTDEAITLAASEVFKQHLPLTLNPVRIAHSDIYHKTFFIQFSATPQLTLAAAVAKTGFPPHCNYELDPHLSMLYAKVSESVRTTLSQSVHLPMSAITFDAVRAIESEVPLSSPEQVRRWRTICEIGPVNQKS